MRNFVPDGCKFEISLPIETFRIEKYGNEEDFTRLILKELKVTDVFYDIGASVGLVSINAAKKCKIVYAFEPDPSVRSRLERNSQLNFYENLNIINWAVSNVRGEVNLFSDGVEGYSASLVEIGKRDSVKVNCDKIDSAIKRGDISIPDVVKMDIEGAEILALQGMRETLNSISCPRVLFVEIHPDYLKKFNSSEKGVLDLLKSYGYKREYLVWRSNQVHAIFRKKG